MKAEEFINELFFYSIRYPEEQKKVDEFIRFIRCSGSQAFRRDFAKGHITASAWLLNGTRDKALLVQHKKLRKLIQPGGHCEETDASVKEAALRELKEETGICGVRLMDGGIFDIEIHSVPCWRQVPPHRHYDVRYLFVCEDDGKVSVSDESDFADWYFLEALRSREDLDLSVKNMCDKTAAFFSENMGIKKLPHC